ncbi:UNVERIFIED_CONTAM: hypothetical protein Sradi_6190000 [Sesamum radiatum]|uniref:Reverse transcriptase domain-containing protein n=1 Tax=Sesamum radiatum TaxID=300843 RepID=A0AAW2K9Z7_SESRA
MDASQGYHQIMLAPEDRKKVSFITSSDTFCYVAMSFGLKNAGVTYQRLVKKIFRPQIRRNVEVYVNNITTIKAQVLADFISEVARNIRRRHLSDQVWLLHVDGSSTTQGSGAGIVITSHKELKTSFDHFQITQIPREENVKADCLSKLASALEDYRTRLITIQCLPEARALLAVQPITTRVDWRTATIRWIEGGHLPDDRWEAARLKTRATRFLIQAGTLYKRSYTQPCCGACPHKKESMSSKRYIAVVVELMLALGLWPLKPYEQDTSGLP